jgi:hypothetical protein
MSRKVRITRLGQALYLYLDDPAVERGVLGPKGNFVRVVYGPGAQRRQHEAAIRGYGERGTAVLQELLEVADKVARARGLGDNQGPLYETELGAIRI